MKKWITDIIISIFILAIICLIFLKLGWIYSFSDVGVLYKILALVIIINTAIRFLRRRIMKNYIE